MYYAWIDNCNGPIAMGKTKSQCLEVAIYVLIMCVNHPTLGKTCRELLDGELGDVNSPKLRIVKGD